MKITRGSLRDPDQLAPRRGPFTTNRFANRVAIGIAALAIATGGALAGCGEDDPGNTAEDAAEEARQAGEDVRDEVGQSDVPEEVGGAAEDAADQAGQVAEDAGERAGDAANEAADAVDSENEGGG